MKNYVKTTPLKLPKIGGTPKLPKLKGRVTIKPVKY